MPQFPWLDPSPFFFQRGRIGCLLIHGFTGAPIEMRPMGEYLAEHDITVSGPRLPGHGTVPEDMQGVTWEEWYSAVETSHQGLSASCDRVFVCGFSLGALLALRLAALRDLPGLVVLSPALEVRDWRACLIPLARLFIKSVSKQSDPAKSDLTDRSAFERFWSYDVYLTEGAYQLWRLQKRVRSELGRIRCPTLIVYSTRDSVIGPHSGRTIYERIASQDKKLQVLQHSGHGIVLDAECRAVFEAAYQWISTH